MFIIVIVLLYFLVLLAISRRTVRRDSNDAFFRAERRSPWYMVAFGMVGASISGVTFVSVPGMVLMSGMTYLQLCLGFILGYLAIAFVLLPVYYKLNLTSIYTYLGGRLGPRSYTTGASFFLLSKMIGSAVKFYVVCLVLQQFIVIPGIGARSDWQFVVITLGLVFLIWLYTRRGGVRTLVFTDTFQTLCLFTALILIIYNVMTAMDFSLGDAVRSIAADERSRIFVFDDWASPHNFWKQLLSGAFIVIVMTGLDQDMMQKNLTCRTLRDAQKNMCTYGVAFVPANLLFLSLGILLAQFFLSQGTPLPARGDELLMNYVTQTTAAANSSLFTLHSSLLQVLFVLGVSAASFSSADSALTSLTTSYCVDIRRRPDDERLRRRVHVAMCVLFVLVILLIRASGSSSLIDAIYTIVSYTYGPLLGLFAFGLFTRCGVRDRLVPCVCVASPLLCYAIDRIAKQQFDYHFGYELLMLNGLLTFLGLWLLSRSRE